LTEHEVWIGGYWFSFFWLLYGQGQRPRHKSRTIENLALFLNFVMNSKSLAKNSCYYRVLEHGTWVKTWYVSLLFNLHYPLSSDDVANLPKHVKNKCRCSSFFFLEKPFSYNIQIFITVYNIHGYTFPVAKSQNFRLWSSEPLMTFLPSCVRLRQVTASWWPASVIKQSPSWRLHT
jgi:hypothetical protein